MFICIYTYNVCVCVCAHVDVILAIRTTRNPKGIFHPRLKIEKTYFSLDVISYT